MDILFLNHNYRNQGTYYRAMPMAEQLAKRGHRVTLMTVSPKHRWRAARSEVGGVQLVETPGVGQNNSGGGYGPLDNAYRFLHALSHRYDIIHMFDHKPNATFAGFPGRLRGARLVADWADWWGDAGGINDVPDRRIPAVGRFEAWWEKKSKLWADGVVTISTVLEQRALEIGCIPERTLYLPTGAAIDRIRPLPVAEARCTLNVPVERMMMGFIGNAPKEMEHVLRTLQELPDLWLMLVGRKNPGVLDLAHSLGVADRLWQTGFISDEKVEWYLACADFMVLPMVGSAANQGRLPNKLLDYMAAGRPVLSNPVGDVAMILKEYQVGLLVDDLDFTKAAQHLMVNLALRNQLGENARHAAETAFNWSILANTLEAFYRQLQSEGRKKQPVRSSTCM